MLKVSAGTLLSVRCLRWVLLVGHSLSNSACSFHLQLSAALSVNYRGTLQLDISPFTLYLKQHAATSKKRGCLWCSKKKELQWSAKNQCNFLEPCFIHLLSPEVRPWSPEVHGADVEVEKLHYAFCKRKAVEMCFVFDEHRITWCAYVWNNQLRTNYILALFTAARLVSECTGSPVKEQSTTYLSWTPGPGHRSIRAEQSTLSPQYELGDYRANLILLIRISSDITKQMSTVKNDI